MIEKDMADIDAFICRDMQSNADYLRQIAVYLTERHEPPLHLKVLLLSLKMLDYKGHEHVQSATIFEYIFAATDLHNDKMTQKIACQDERLNQGLKGKDSRILVGDFFYARAYSLMAKLGKMAVVSHLSNAINQYAEGQSLQISQADDFATSQQQYFQRLKRKSCLYFTCVAQVIGELSDCTQTQTEALCDYARHLGMAVQIVEETLCCIRADSASEHKQSNLPFIVIRGLQQATPVLRELIEKQPTGTNTISQICLQTDALAYAHSQIESDLKRATGAVDVFPHSIYRQALQDLATDLLSQYEHDLADLGYPQTA